ncbi:MAG: hypothetical protein ACI4U1_03315 [Anaerovoracaceae bacterium]
MSNKTANLLKAAFFIIMALGIIAYKIFSPSVETKIWMWLALILSVVLAIAFIKNAFEK